MRAIGLLLLAVMPLGGCGPESGAGDPPSSQARAANVIPAAFHGIYDRSIDSCARPSQDRLTVSARELRFHESIGIVRSVNSGPSDSIRVEADYQGEGESWRAVRELRLSNGGGTLTVGGDGTRLDRVRCPAGER
jgi:hypothetical protein